MDARHAGTQQLGALSRAVLDAERQRRPQDRRRRARAPRASAGGTALPDSCVMRWIWRALVIGMIPATSGTSTPARRARSTKSK